MIYIQLIKTAHSLTRLQSYCVPIFYLKSLKMQTIIDKNRYLVIDSEPFILPGNDKAIVICYLDGENGITRFLKIVRLPVVEHQMEFAVCLEDIA